MVRKASLGVPNFAPVNNPCLYVCSLWMEARRFVQMECDLNELPGEHKTLGHNSCDSFTEVLPWKPRGSRHGGRLFFR